MAFQAVLRIVSLPSFSNHPHNHHYFPSCENISSSFPSKFSLYPNASTTQLHHYQNKPSNRLNRLWLQQQLQQSSSFSFTLSHRFFPEEDEADEDYDDGAENWSFDEAVELFNRREYYKCHDCLEALWNQAEEPKRTLLHGILQCAVGFHHLFNQNHRGAMMELGEGLCKLKKMNFKSGPFQQFEQDITAALEFIYRTQIELAACGDELCVTMDQSERSYQLLGGYAAGQHLYNLQIDSNDDEVTYIVFCPRRSYDNNGEPEPTKVKLPTLCATTELLKAYEYD